MLILNIVSTILTLNPNYKTFIKNQIVLIRYLMDLQNFIKTTTGDILFS